MKSIVLDHQDTVFTINYREECKLQLQAAYKPAGREGGEENIVLMADVLITFRPFDDGYTVSRAVPMQVLVSEIKLKHMPDQAEDLIVIMPENFTVNDNDLIERIGAMLIECHDNYFGRSSF